MLFKSSNNVLSKISIFINDNGFEKIFFYNYKCIIDFNENFVNIDNYIVYGEKLIVNKLEDSIIEIFGKIERIEKSEE